MENKQLTLLIVGESRANRKLLRSAMGTDFDLLESHNWQEAVETVSSRPVAALIIRAMDNGSATIDALRSIKTSCPTVPLVLVADQPDTDLVIGAFRCGASDVVEGTFDVASLIRCLERIGVAASNQSKPESTAGEPIVSETAASKRPKSSRSRARAGRNGRKEACEGDAGLSLRMHCFGAFRVLVNQQQIGKPLSRKGRAILVFLALHRQQPTHRDVLMEEFWPDSTPDSARNCLNFTLHGVRERFREVDSAHDWILYQDAHYFLNPEFEIWSDVSEFLQVWQAGTKVETEKSLGQAVPYYETASELYQGDFMEEERYVSWPSLERDKLREAYLAILDKLSSYYYSQGRQSEAVSLCNTILQIDGPREDVHRRLMACYYELGDRDKALKQFLRCKTVLESEFDLEPTSSTIELAQLIKNQSFSFSNS